jgi:DNA invertase Pin-like site-specific DNA recombinase
MPNGDIPFKAGDKVIAYAYYSRGQEQGSKNTSTKEQIAEIQRFCNQNDLFLIHAYADEWISGKTTAGREQFHEMIYDLRQKPRMDIKGVVLWSFSRFARIYDYAQYFKSDIRCMGYLMYSINDKIEDSSTGRLIEAVNDYSNQRYIEQVSADVKRALRSNFTQYKAMPGYCPLRFIKIPVEMPLRRDGSIREAFRWEPDPNYIPKFRHAFDMRLQGASYSDIYRYLELYKDSASIKKMFNSKLFYGHMEYGNSVIQDYCIPIVTKEIWEKCHVMEKEIKKKMGGRPGGYGMTRALLSGFIFCGISASKYWNEQCRNYHKKSHRSPE